jgi:hypothetical protein
MSKLLTGSIDLNKIDKTKIISTDKNGNPFENGAKYLNVVVWVNDEVDNYGNKASIQISQSKEERDAGVKATYIGNLKEPQSRTNEPTSTRTAQVADDLPF